MRTHATLRPGRPARFVLVALALAACNTANRDKDPTDEVVEDSSSRLDTGGDTDGDTQPQTNCVAGDTGCFFVLNAEGYATVTGSTFVGWQAFVSRWRKPDGSLSDLYRCAYVYDVKDWESAGRTSLNPLSTKLDLCDGCTFTFTVVPENQRELARVPWEVPEDTDADTDTDVDTDTDTTPTSDPNTPLTCQWLRDRDVLSLPGEEDGLPYLGVGFNPSYDKPRDPKVGAIMYWYLDQQLWAAEPQTYGATFINGVLRWDSVLESYTLDRQVY